VKIAVTGLSLISALGSTLEATWSKLLQGDSGIYLHQPFPELSPYPLGLIESQPSNLTKLTEQAVLAVLQDASLALPLPKCGVVIGSSRGNQAAWEQLVRQSQQVIAPYAWLDTLPNVAAITAARQSGAQGPVLAPMAACATGLWAIAQGMELLQTGQCQQVIVGALEAPITPLTLTGFKQMGALAQTGAYPFDCRREGLALAEGGAILVLESMTEAQQRGAKIYGQLLGFGLTVDGYHVSAPAPGREAAIAAVNQCLSRSNLASHAIDYIHAHGTATQLNDQAEAYLIQKLFSLGVPVSSTKGATGHTLGASGALGVAFCLMALQKQILPPCVGLLHSAFDLNLISKARSQPLSTALCFSFGFGGQNAALAIGSV